MCEYFECTVEWDALDNLIFICKDKKVIITKNNKMSVEFVQQTLSKLGLTMQDFELGYDSVFKA